MTLSACETAMGSDDKGVEVEGLGVILQNKRRKVSAGDVMEGAGRRDRLLMEEFYRARGEEWKTTKAGALRQAQLALLQGRVRAENPKIDLTHPHYWAPFGLMGNWM